MIDFFIKFSKFHWFISLSISPGYKSLLNFVRNQAQALINQRRTFLPTSTGTMWSVLKMAHGNLRIYPKIFVRVQSFAIHSFYLHWFKRVIFFYSFSPSLSLFSLQLCQYTPLYVHIFARKQKEKQSNLDSNQIKCTREKCLWNELFFRSVNRWMPWSKRKINWIIELKSSSEFKSKIYFSFWKSHKRKRNSLR